MRGGGETIRQVHIWAKAQRLLPRDAAPTRSFLAGCLLGPENHQHLEHH